MEKTAKAAVGTGVLTSLWPLIGNTADISKAYPDELLSIDAYTKGKVSTGDIIDAGNVELVKDLLDPVLYIQISQMGRKIRIATTTTDVTKLFPHDFLEASLKRAGMAVMDENQNVVVKGTGAPWIGGMPFPEPQNATEGFANLALSWGGMILRCLRSIPNLSMPRVIWHTSMTSYGLSNKPLVWLATRMALT